MGKWKKYLPRRKYKGHLQERTARADAVTALAEMWTADTHWFVPAAGTKLLMLIQSLITITGVGLWLDSPETVMHVEGPAAFLAAFSAIPAFGNPAYVSGVFTVPRSTPMAALRAAFPGRFQTDPPAGQKVILLITTEEIEAGGVEFPTLMVDAAMFADPEAGDMIASNLAEP